MVRPSFCVGALAVFLIAPCFVPVPAHAQSDQIGVSAAVRGNVTVSSGVRSRTPGSGEAMYLGDRVVTRTQSGMQIMLLDESVFTIGENNDFVIDRFVYDPDRSVAEIAARLSQGFLRYVSGGAAAIAPQNVSLRTPSATIGTRGTSIDVIVGEEAIAFARSMGLIGPGDQVDPGTAVFVILRGPSTSYDGISQRGRVVVQTPNGSVEMRREGFGVLVPFAGAAPFAPAPIGPVVNQSVVSSIELPGIGSSLTIGDVEITDFPNIDSVIGGLVNPGPGPTGVSPDVTGPGFEEEIPPAVPDPPFFPPL